LTYRKNLLIAEFNRDLLLQGYTSIPNLLFQSYRDLGLNDLEMLILLQLIYWQSAANELCPSLEQLSSRMSTAPGEIERSLKSLLEKKIICLEQIIDAESLEDRSVYNLEGIFDQLAEVWALERNREIEEQQRLRLARNKREKEKQDALRLSPGLKAGPLTSTISAQAALVYQDFENEFGRPLSPIEGELIMQWCAQIPSELILEALRISVLLGKLNLRYIESILLDWQRKSIRTLREVRELEEAYFEKKADFVQKTGRNRANLSKKTPKKTTEDKYRDLYSI